MRKFASLALAVVFGLGGLLAGCSSKPTPAAPPATAPADNTGTSAPGSKPFAGVTLRVAYMAGTYSNAARLIAQEFEQRTGAKIEITEAPYTTLHEKYLADLVSGNSSFDVVTLDNRWDGEFAPYLEDLDPYLKKANIDLNGMVPAVRDNAGFWEGKRLGVPMAVDAFMVAYRTDLFEKENLKPPTTWDEYADLARKLTKNGMYGTSLAGIKPQLFSPWVPRLWSMGGRLADKDWKVRVNDDIGVKATQKFKDLFKFMPPGVLSYGIPEVNAAFMNGEVAMAEVWPSLARGDFNNPAKSKVVGKWGLFPYPGDKFRYSHQSAWDMGIPKSAKNKPASWEWIKTYTSPENSRLFFNKIGVGSPWAAVWQDPEVVKQAPEAAAILEAIKIAYPKWRIPIAGEAVDTMNTALSEILSGQKEIKPALDAVAKKWTQLIAEAKPTVFNNEVPQ